MKSRKSHNQLRPGEWPKKWILGSLLSVGMLFSRVPAGRAQISEADTGEFRRIEQPLRLKAGVAIAGAGLIGLELWWFLLSKNKSSDRPN